MGSASSGRPTLGDSDSSAVSGRRPVHLLPDNLDVCGEQA
jgi:hypothetical protein